MSMQDLQIERFDRLRPPCLEAGSVERSRVNCKVNLRELPEAEVPKSLGQVFWLRAAQP